jgi:putative oxidoreductase
LLAAARRMGIASGESVNRREGIGLMIGTWLDSYLRLVRHCADLCVRALRGLLWPKFELAIRLWLAQMFFVSGALELTRWQTVHHLASHGYSVAWMSPASAAYVGVSIEVLGGALLAAGFMTRYCAALMLTLSVIVQFDRMPLDSQLFGAVLCGWYTVFGAGPIAIDTLLRRGLADSALPLIPRILRASEWARSSCGPFFLSLMRIWLGAALMLATMRPAWVPGDNTARLGAWFPLSTVERLSGNFVLVGGLLLLLGLATRYVMVAIALVLLLCCLMDPRLTDAVYLLMMSAIFIVYGAGKLSADHFIVGVVEARWGDYSRRNAASLPTLPRVVIVGAGFGGLSCAWALRSANASVTLIDRANHHLFQPLLYQVATAGLSPSDIAAPVRPLFRASMNTRVLLGAVSGIDSVGQRVLLGREAIPYDYLVLSTGATHSYFGNDAWTPYAPGLKRIEDAIEIRRRILIAFERAEATADPVERAALLTFLIVGGGPTGVELAGAIAELARFGMDKDFRNFDPADARVVLVQSAARLLPAFPEILSMRARRSLEKLDVEVLIGSPVERIDAVGVAVSGKIIAARTVLWAAGVKASPAAKWLRARTDNAGRVQVAADLSVPNLRNVYVIGDTAASNGWRGRGVPGLASAAKQGGRYVARQIRAKIDGTRAPAAFAYRHLGSLATIGRKAAVADFGFIKLWGAPAWWLWGAVHVGFLLGVRNRLATMINWFWSYLTLGGGIRLITGPEAASVAPNDKSVDSSTSTIAYDLACEAIVPIPSNAESATESTT